MAFTSSGEVTIYATTPPTNSNNFSTSTVIYVPAESVDAYKTAWSSLASKIEAIQE